MEDEIKLKKMYGFLLTVAIIVMAIGTVNKIMHYPYALELRLGGLVSTVVFAAALRLKSKLKNGSFFRILGIVALIGGLVFKRMHYPGASILQILGCISAVVWAFISLLLKKKS